ncbi:MAG: ABC transporter permease [Chloroflexi bacterium]|nr:ABC transporter permease [Chloroflexota bacterium]
MSTPFWEGVLTGAVQSGVSVLYAALGEVIVERAGIINLGVEGSMLMGASVGFAVAFETGNALVGVVCGALAAGIFSLVHAYLVVTRHANQLASGLTLMFFGIGLSALLGKSYVGRMIDGLPQIPLPGLSQLPYVGNILFNHDILIYLVVPIAILIWWVLFNTRWGLALRAVGESQVVAYAAGLKPAVLQYQAVFLGGLLAGLGGAHLSLAYTRVWGESMTNGRGFIAVALVIFATWHPLRAILGALLFGGALAFQLQLQARGAPVSPFLLDMLPYLLTLLVLLIVGRTRKNAMPEGLKSVFEGTTGS